MEVKEIIKKKKELESQIQGLVNNFYKETDVPIGGIEVMYNFFCRKYFTEVKLKNPFD